MKKEVKQKTFGITNTNYLKVKNLIPKQNLFKFNEFQPIIDWWNKREENDRAWKVNVNRIKDWDLDIKNPISPTEETTHTTGETLTALRTSLETSSNIISELETLLK